MEQDAREVLAALEDSGASVASFAKREGLSAARVYYWRTRLSGPSVPGFVEMVPDECVSEPRHGVFEVVVRSGRLVRVPADFDALALRRLVAVLEGEQC